MSGGGDGPTRAIDPSSVDGPTKVVGGGGGQVRHAPNNIDSATHIVGARPTGQLPEAWDPMSNPVSGLLVVVAGPEGKGEVRTLGYGLNAVGRGEDVRVKMLYGGGVLAEGGNTRIIQLHHKDVMRSDPKMSREHFIITYDSKNKRFYIQGSPNSTNLTYLKKMGDDEPILSPQELKPYARIQAGATELMFIPVCHRNEDGTGFDWQDQ